MKYALPERFIATCLRVGLPEVRAIAAWNDLAGRYAEAHRFYHNLSHIDKMLSWLDASHRTDDVIELALWYHDSVYEPLGGENEVRSARNFKDHLGELMAGSTADDVERLIIATDPKRSRTGRPDEDLLVDIDLSILGASPEEYEAYRLAIRREYSVIPEPDFVAGRRAVLESFLSRPIFATDLLAALEGQARLNIKNELEHL